MTWANFVLDTMWIFHSTVQNYELDYNVWGGKMKDLDNVGKTAAIMLETELFQKILF